MKDSKRNIRLSFSLHLGSLFTIFLFVASFSSFSQNIIKIAQKDSQTTLEQSKSFSHQTNLYRQTISFKTKVRPDLFLGFNVEESESVNNLTVINYTDGESHFVLERSSESGVRIKNIVNGKYLEVSEDMAIHGGSIEQGERRNSNSQVFQLVSLGDGYYSLVSHLNFNLALEVSSYGTGYPLVLKNRQKIDTQAFKMIKN